MLQDTHLVPLSIKLKLALHLIQPLLLQVVQLAVQLMHTLELPPGE
jgi:hypothetical protein